MEDKIKYYRQGAIRARSIDELIGLCRGIVADEKVCQAEAKYLLNWLKSAPQVAGCFPACLIYPRLLEILADGELSSSEAVELLNSLKDLTGEQGQDGAIPMSTTIAFDDPPPYIDFAYQSFCLTGEFAYGRRKDVEERITSLGGRVSKSMTSNCILVVGCMGSNAWVHSTHGRKMEAAVELRDDGHPVSIVSESHWHNCAEHAEEKNRQKEAESERTRSRKAVTRLLEKGV